MVYNNINFIDTKRDKILGYRSSIKAIITVVIIIYPEILVDRLDQSIHNPYKKLDFLDILNTPAICSNNNSIRAKITHSLIADTIKRIYPDSIIAVF
jgi:hypothetical protein